MAIKRGITISFKNTTKDLTLYNLLKDMEDKSTEIKAILYKALVLNKDIEKITPIKKESKIEKEEVDILNF